MGEEIWKTPKKISRFGRALIYLHRRFLENLERSSPKFSKNRIRQKLTCNYFINLLLNII